MSVDNEVAARALVEDPTGDVRVDAPARGLLRNETVKDDGRRLTRYSRSTA